MKLKFTVDLGDSVSLRIPIQELEILIRILEAVKKDMERRQKG